MPPLDELHAAFEAGRTAGPKETNPHFPGSPLHIEWDYGRREGALFVLPNPNTRITKVARAVLLASAATIAFSFLRYALL